MCVCACVRTHLYVCVCGCIICISGLSVGLYLRWCMYVLVCSHGHPYANVYECRLYVQVFFKCLFMYVCVCPLLRLMRLPSIHPAATINPTVICFLNLYPLLSQKHCEGNSHTIFLDRLPNSSVPTFICCLRETRDERRRFYFCPFVDVRRSGALRAQDPGNVGTV